MPGARAVGQAETVRSDTRAIGLSLAAVATLTWLLARVLQLTNPATVSTAFLLVVLVVAAVASLRAAIVTSVATFDIADSQNWVALGAFLVVSLVASNLSAVARARTAEAVSRREEQARLFDLSRDVLVLPDDRGALDALARSVARRFDLEFVAVALPLGAAWDVHQAGAPAIELDRRELSTALAAAQTTLEFDAASRAYSGQRETVVGDRVVRLVPLRAGTRPIGLLAAAGRALEPGTLDALAGVVAIAIERASLLEERKAADLTKRSEALKTTLLASIGHDLRTPLTAIRVAAANLQDETFSAADRHDQGELIQAEVERLARLFQNLMDMARIDAGGVAFESRRAFPSEIVAAARDQVELALGRHRVTVDVETDLPVRLDPRLTASALARVLENAAQYAPGGTAIEVTATVTGEGLVIAVRDHGPGIAADDLPHLFERFYRGTASRGRSAGSGMGLWIARGFLSAQNGRVWAENAAGGGACVTMVVPLTDEPVDDVPAPRSRA